MQQAWQGIGLPANTMVLTDVFVSYSLLVVLDETPGVSTVISLPDTTMGVQFWTTDAMIWVAVGTGGSSVVPGPIPPPVQSGQIGPDSFKLGGIIVPNMLYTLAIPDDTLAHSVSLVSQSQSPLVYVTALRATP